MIWNVNTPIKVRHPYAVLTEQAQIPLLRSVAIFGILRNAESYLKPFILLKWDLHRAHVLKCPNALG